jgi:hypothetical protein
LVFHFPKGFRARHFGVGGVGGNVETNEIRLLSSIDGFGVFLRYIELIRERILRINNYG